MTPVILAGSAHPALAANVAKELGQPLGACDITRFPDGELEIEVKADVRGRDVYLVQPTRPPVGEHLLELTLLSDACRRSGAASVTAVARCQNVCFALGSRYTPRAATSHSIAFRRR